MLSAGGHLSPGLAGQDRGAALRRGLMAAIMLAALVLVFVDSKLVTGAAVAALVLYLSLARRQFGFGGVRVGGLIDRL